MDYKFEPKEKGPKKESLADRARRASGGRVETVRKARPEGEGGEDAREAQRSSRKAASPKAEKVKPAAKPAPKKGPSRTGPSKRGA